MNIRQHIQLGLKGAFSFSTFFGFGLLIWFTSCNDLLESEFNLSESKKVKSISSRFISHQTDTREKDNKIVAVANFNPDGTVGQFLQHMTYPYNLEEPNQRVFWAEPDHIGLYMIMDGLNLGHAEKNFLFGNDWPVSYAKASAEKSPLFEDNEFVKFKNDINYGPSGRPEVIVTEPDHLRGGFPYGKHFEEFKYDGKQVSNYKFYRFINIAMFPEEMRASFATEEDKKHFIADVEFSYEGDNLVGIKQKNIDLRFYYEGSRIVKSEFYLHDKLYNHRIYSYNNDGQKIKTEIFNVDQVPEYTIYYEYDYY